VKRYLLILFVSLLGLGACGRDWQLDRAKVIEKRGYYVEASMKYDAYVKKHPGSPLAPEALYRTGRIYQKKIRIYSAAQRYFKNVIEKYPSSEPWAGLAKKGLLDSPDYYPLNSGNFWIEGDYASGGRNMRAEWTCQLTSSGTYRITRKISAGSQLVTKVERYFRKDNAELREYITPDSAAGTLIYSYPVEKGREWKTSRDGRELKLSVMETDLAVKVKAGEFTGCVKIGEEYPGSGGSKKINYYAPDVGWILTATSGSSGQEFRSSELISYKIFPEEQ
jgi:hypothetical protein